MRCPSCQRKNPDGYLYCVYCGRLLQSPPGEKRFATVLFFDLSGFTHFTHGHGPERAWEEVRQATDTAQKAVARHRGRVHATFGDGLLAFFGLNQSRGKQEARHALAAAWEMVQEIEAQVASGRLGLQGRAVVTSGFVFSVPNGNGQDLLGDPINRAHRLIVATPPGAVYLDDTTLALASGAVTQALEPIQAKGFPEPLRAYRLLGFQEPGNEPLAGEALAELRSRWEAARRGRPRVAVLVGPPGVGKNLVLEAFQKAHPELRVMAPPAFEPGLTLRGWLMQYLQENPGLREELAALPIDPETRRTFLAALGEGPERIPSARLGRAALKVLEELARTPFALVIKNLHHAPRAVIAFLRLVERAGRGCYMVVATARKGRFPGRIPLRPLDRETGLAALAHRWPQLSPSQRRAILERSGGLAGVIEALVRVPGDEGLAAAFQPHFDALPSKARELLLFASVLGDPLDASTLDALLGPGAEEAVRRLLQDGFLESGKDGLRFAHPVYRRAAQALVAEKRRRSWHRAVAEVLLRRGEALEAARHYHLAENPGAAIRVLRALARAARDREAVRLLRQAKALARTKAQEQPVRLELAERLVAIEPERALSELAGLTSPRARFLRALAEENRGRAETAVALWRDYLKAQPDDREAWRRYLPLAPLAELKGHLAHLPPDPELEELAGRRLAGEGEIEAASRLIERAASRWRAETQGRAAKLWLELAGLAWRRFAPKEARVWARRARDAAQDPGTRGLAEAVLGSLALDLGNLGEATRRIEAAIAQLPLLPTGETRARIAGIHLRLLIETGRVPQAAAEGERLLADADHPWLHAMAALVRALAGDARGALDTALRLQDQADSDHTRAFLALARAFALTKLGLDPKAAFLEAFRLAKSARNPYAYYLALASLAIYHRRNAPRKTDAIATQLLKGTWQQGFLPFHHLARLLKAETSLRQGKPVLHLLRFESPFGVLEFWRRSLVRAAGGQAAPMDRATLWGYGILGKFAWKVWERVWIPARKSALD